MVPVVFWLLAAFGLKKADDYRASFMSEEEYLRLLKEADERDKRRKKKLLALRKKL